RVDLDHGGVPGVLVAGSLDLGGPDQADLAGDLGGQVLDRDGAVTLPQRNRLGRGGAQRLGLGLTELAAAGGGDQPVRAGGQQRSWVGVALQHGQVGVVQPVIAQGRANGRDQLVGEGPDTGLAPADLGGEAGHGPHPTSSDARAGLPNSTGSRPEGATSGSRAKVSASMRLLLACRAKNRRRSAALGEGTRDTVGPRRPKNTATGSHAGPVGSMTTTSW